MILALVWAYCLGVGWFLRDEAGDHWPSWDQLVAVFLWPATVPVGLAYHRWRWGPRSSRYVYSDLHWWQRGERERRPRP